MSRSETRDAVGVGVNEPLLDDVRSSRLLDLGGDDVGVRACTLDAGDRRDTKISSISDAEWVRGKISAGIWSMEDPGPVKKQNLLKNCR